MNGRGIVEDDLTAIKGIGLARKKWLAETFDVSTFADLAALTVDEIETALKAAGKLSSRTEIEAWIAQAQALAAESTAAQSAEAEQENGELAEDGRPTQLINRKGNVNATSLSRGAWQPMASFVVEFQSRNGQDTAAEWRTVAHYMEADSGANWPGTETEQLCQWIKQQVSFSKQVESVATAPVPQTEAAAPSPITLQVREIRLIQPPDYSATIDISKRDHTFLGHVRREQPITLEVGIELAGLSASTATPVALNYRAQCLLHNLSTGKHPYLLDMEVRPLTGEQPVYQTQLADLSLEPGMYKLGVLLKGKTPFSTNYFELPKLNVL